MPRHPFVAILLSFFFVWSLSNWIADRPVHPRDGILVDADPQQDNYGPSIPVTMGRWMLTPRAHYEVTARILARERYYIDGLSDLVPEDLALGWGPMSDNRILRTIDISQSGRFYFWRTHADTPIPFATIIDHSANTHVIPADGAVRRELLGLRRGQLVSLSGDLVDGTRDDGRWIKTSLVRDDTGPGACEVLLVRKVAVLQ
ncbi:MAG: hypothetical protein ACLQJ0_17920 [Steroidobacteraceae bacterium]|jgi:hypothetical protein